MKHISLVTLLFYLLLTSAMAKSKKPLEISVHPNVELATIVQTLADKMFNTASPYYDKVKKEFAPFASHKAVTMSKEVFPDQGWWSSPGWIGLRLSTDRSRKLIIPFDKNISPFSSQEQLLEYIDALRDFAHQTQFDAFFKANKKLYDSVLQDIHTNLAKQNIDIPDYLEAYYGLEGQPKYVVHISLLGPPGGYAPLTYSNEKIKPFIIQPNQYVNGKFDFNINHFAPLFFHELSHSVINPIVANQYETFNKSAILLGPIKKTMKWADGLKDWEHCVNEHIIRATTARFLYHKFGQEAAERELQRQQDNLGFIYTRSLYNKLMAYEQQRNQYSSLTSYLPVLAQTLDSIKKTITPFTGPNWNALKNKEYKFYVYVYPTAETSPAAQDSILAAITEFKKLGKFNSFVIPDTQALAMDARYTFVCFGTMTSNKYLAQYKDKIPVTITPEKVSIADTTITGNNHWVFLGVPHPDNPALALFVSTAQSAAYLYLEHMPYFWNRSFIVGTKEKVIETPYDITMDENYELKAIKK